MVWIEDALAGGVGDDELLLGAWTRHEAHFEPPAVHVLAEEAGIAVDLDHPAFQHGDVHAIHKHVGRSDRADESREFQVRVRWNAKWERSVTNEHLHVLI